MAQHDYVIDNQTAPNFRADLNNALAAIVSTNSGAFAPSPTYANMLWYDTTLKLLRMRSEANDAWIDLGTLDQVAKTFAANVLLASQTEAEAGTNNTKTMTPLRTKQAIDSLVQVLPAIAGASAGDVGTYAFAATANTTAADSFGATRAGSGLFPIGLRGHLGYTLGDDTTPATISDFGGNGSALSGTWRCMGLKPARIVNNAAAREATLWLRIS